MYDLSAAYVLEESKNGDVANTDLAKFIAEVVSENVGRQDPDIYAAIYFGVLSEILDVYQNEVYEESYRNSLI